MQWAVEEALLDLEAVAVHLEEVALDLDTVVEDLVVFMPAMFMEDMALEAVHSSDVELGLEELLACIRGRYIDHTIIAITSITEPCSL
jgi:hypothetical protein